MWYALCDKHRPAVHLSLAVQGIQGSLLVLVAPLVQAELAQVEGHAQGDQVGQVVQDLQALLSTQA